MLTAKYFCVVWFLLGITSEIKSSEYLHFGGDEEKSKQAEYYLSDDSSVKAGSSDELIRKQRSFWKLLRHGLFGRNGNCCNNCNYDVGNGENYNSGSPLLPQFQPLRPLPLLGPLEPLFGRLNYNNYGTSYKGDGNGNLPSYSTNTYSDSGVNSSPSDGNNEPLPPQPAYKIPKLLTPPEANYQIDNSPVTKGTYDTTSKPADTEKIYKASKLSADTNNENSKEPQYSNVKVPQIIYQPIIYVSPQYQDNKPFNQDNQEGIKYGAISKQDENPQSPSYEIVLNEEYKQIYSSSFDKNTSLDNVSNSLENIAEKEQFTVVPSCNVTVPLNEEFTPSLVYPSSTPSVSTVSTVYNIVTPSLLHSLTTSQNLYPNSVVPNKVSYSSEGAHKFPLYPSNYVLFNNYPLAKKHPIVSSTVSAPSASPYIEPIQLTYDDQPYRECPELFKEYQRKLNSFLPRSGC